MSAPRVRLLYVVRTESASKKDKYLTQPRQNSAFPMAIAAAYYLCLPKDLENKQKCGSGIDIPAQLLRRTRNPNPYPYPSFLHPGQKAQAWPDFRNDLNVFFSPGHFIIFGLPMCVCERSLFRRVCVFNFCIIFCGTPFYEFKFLRSFQIQLDTLMANWDRLCLCIFKREKTF